MIIFDNKEYYNKLIEKGFEKFPNRRDLTILANEWYKNDNMPKDKIANALDTFCLKWCKDFNPSKFENTILDIVSNLDMPTQLKYEPQKIVFYKSEIEKILTLSTENERKILFILMCLGKRNGLKYLYLNSGTPLKFSEIGGLANVKLSCEKQDLLLRSLFKANAMDIKIKPLLKCEVLWIEDCGDIAFEVEWNENLIENYLLYVKNNFIKCLYCGKYEPIKSNHQKYCSRCAKIVNAQKARKNKLNKV